MHHICIIIGIILYKVPGISSIERFIAKKVFGQKTCVFVLPLLDLEEQEIFTSWSAAHSAPRSSPIPTQQLPYWAPVGICGKDLVLSSICSCRCITGRERGTNVKMVEIVRHQVVPRRGGRGFAPGKGG